MVKSRVFAILSLLLFLSFCGKAGKAALPPDSISEDMVYEFTFSDPGKARQIMQQLRERKLSPGFELDITEGDLVFNLGEYYHALKFYKSALESKSITDDANRYLEVLHRMVFCYDMLHRETEKMRCVELILKKARECGNKEMESVALFNMGKSAYYQGDKKNGYKFMLDGVELMEKTDYRNKYDNLRYDYNTLIVFYSRDGRFEDAYRVLQSLKEVISKSTGEETDMAELDYREQKSLMAHSASILNKLGREKEAKEAYGRFMELDKVYPNNNNLIFPYLFEKGMYNEIINMSLEGEARLKANGDTINYHATTYLRALGNSYYKKGDYKKSAEYMGRLAVLYDSLKSREQNSAALELAAFYDSAEKDMQIHRQSADARVRNVFLAGACVAILLLGVLLWRSITNSRLIRRKNTDLVDTVKDLLVNKDELLRATDENLALRKEIESLRKDSAVAADDVAAVVDSSEAPLLEDSGKYGKPLFELMEHEIINRKLYLDPEFTRDDLIKIAYIPRNKFASFFKQYSGMSFTKYITNLRLEHAARLLENHPNYTIEAIAAECGMPASTTFYRSFLEKFGVTPMEFRKVANRR